MTAGYQEPTGIDSRQPEVGDALEQVVCEGARQMLAAALEAEVTAFLGRGRYERRDGGRSGATATAPARRAN